MGASWFTLPNTMLYDKSTLWSFLLIYSPSSSTLAKSLRCRGGRRKCLATASFQAYTCFAESLVVNCGEDGVHALTKINHIEAVPYFPLCPTKPQLHANDLLHNLHFMIVELLRPQKGPSCAHCVKSMKFGTFMYFYMLNHLRKGHKLIGHSSGRNLHKSNMAAICQEIALYFKYACIITR